MDRRHRPRTVYKQPEDMDETIQEEEVEDAVAHIKLGKDAGMDDVAPELVKFGGPTLIKALQNLFQRIWNSGTIPGDWEEN